MRIDPNLSDSAVLAELGARCAYRRVSLGQTQAELAREAGISKRTLERLEAGEPVQTPTLIRVLRQLGLIDTLETVLPPVEPGPVEVLRGGGQVRKRAPRGGKPAARPWRWQDDS